jgi:hypothetical protein
LESVKSFCTIAVLILVCIGYWYSHRPIVYPGGVLIASEPTQIDLPADTPPFQDGEFRLKPLARFSVEARVLHREIYRYDKASKLVPVDLALGWGPMSDQRVLDQLSISQSMRFYWYHWKHQPPIPEMEIISHSTNVHVIPATGEIASRCRWLRAGTLVHLAGDLVEASGPKMSVWRSSLSRTDTGNGACELMWVRELSILNDKSGQDRQSFAKQ